MSTLFDRFLDWAGLTDLEIRHKRWRYEQISLELEELQMECAELAAHIGVLTAEREQLKKELTC